MSSDEEIFGKRPKEYFQVKKKKSFGFILSCIFMGFMGVIFMFLGIIGFLNIFFPGKPIWYFIVCLILGILMVLGAILTYKFKKKGVYLFVFTLIVNILFHLSLGFEQIDAINGLYIFIGFALVPIVPRWKLFS